MHRYWQSLIRPLCEATRPQVIVEVGAASGLHTRSILEYCRDRGAHAHIIDPVPLDDTDELRPLLAFATVHRATSLEILPGLEGDVFLLDGDHNWYTVLHELRTIEETARGAGGFLPLVLCHDTGWPYGRRDLYYAPQRIPSEFRNAYARRGIRFGEEELPREGGFNRRYHNALRPGGPRNGVLTAIEDFLAGTDFDWELASFPAFHGLGVLHAPGHVPEHARRALGELLHFSPAALEALRQIEEERLHVVNELMENYRLLGGPTGPRAAALVRAAKRVRAKTRELLAPLHLGRDAKAWLAHRATERESRRRERPRAGPGDSHHAVI